MSRCDQIYKKYRKWRKNYGKQYGKHEQRIQEYRGNA